MSWIVAKLALPITRFNTIRPATRTNFAAASSVALSSAPCCLWRSDVRLSRRKSLGKALPDLRNSVSLARRSSTRLASSGVLASVSCKFLLSFDSSILFELLNRLLNTLFQTCLDKGIQPAVEDALGITNLDSST